MSLPDVAGVLDSYFQNLKEKHVYIMMSSGVDSHTLLFAALRAKKKVTAVSFTLDDRESRDFKIARDTAKEFGVPFLPVVMSTKVELLQKNVKKLAKRFDCKKKSDFECTWPMAYSFYKIAAQHKGKRKPLILSGQAADIYYVLSKKGCIHYIDRPDDYRTERFFEENLGQRVILSKLAKHFGVKHFLPWTLPEMYDQFKGVSWETCNKPRQKEPSRQAYEEEFSRIKVYNHTNFQLGDSGIAELFTKLLDTDWNINNYKSVVGIYNCLVKGII